MWSSALTVFFKIESNILRPLSVIDERDRDVTLAHLEDLGASGCGWKGWVGDRECLRKAGILCLRREVIVGVGLVKYGIAVWLVIGFGSMKQLLRTRNITKTRVRARVELRFRTVRIR